MLTLEAKEFVELLHTLFSLEMGIRGKVGPLPLDTIQAGDNACKIIIGILEKLDLPHSIKVARNMVLGRATAEDVHAGYVQLTNSLMLELEDRKFYGPLRRYEQYYEQAKLFGDEVFDHFPSANNDIFEAGTCLALERGTASIMHLMRVVEAGLKVLAKTLGIGPQNDWGSYLREIDKELAARIKASGVRTSDEQFCAEVALTFDGVRRAWRNPTMHIENNYSPERAEEILVAVRALMRHLATKGSSGNNRFARLV